MIIAKKKKMKIDLYFSINMVVVIFFGDFARKC